MWFWGFFNKAPSPQNQKKRTPEATKMTSKEKLKSIYGVDLEKISQFVDFETTEQINSYGETLFTVGIPTNRELTSELNGVQIVDTNKQGTQWIYYNLDHKKKFDNIVEQHIGFEDLTIFHKVNPEDKRIFIVDTTKEALSLVSCGLNCVSLNGLGNELIRNDKINSITSFPKLWDYMRTNLSYLLDNRTMFFICNNKVIEKTVFYKYIKPLLDNGSFNNYIDSYSFINFDIPIVDLIINDKNKFLQTLGEKTVSKANSCDYDYYVEFEREREKEKLNSVFSTGIENVDIALNGGLRFGLYTIGATSGLGKSTFVSQIGENLANQGFLVLNYSLEMTRAEMFEKGEKRRFYFEKLGVPKDNIKYITLTDDKEELRNVYLSFEKHDKEMISSFSSYIKGNYKIVPTTIDYTIEEFEESLMFWISQNPQRNICVIVDYCQLLNTKNEKINVNDKMKTDRVVHTLKRLSDTYNIIILNVSSLNRNSYYSPIDLTSFKESGGIEYTSNCVIGLDYSIIYDEEFQKLGESKSARAQRRAMYFEGTKPLIKQIKMVVLKARRGTKSTTDLIFNPIYYSFDNPQ